jgi:hypothetical protein
MSKVEATVLVEDSKLKVKQDAYVGSHLDYEVQPPQNNGQPIAVNTSRTPAIIQMPADVWNPYHSYVPFRLTVPGQANRYIWYRSDVWSGCISQIQYYTANTQNIIDIDNLQNYLQNALKAFTSMDELKNGEAKGFLSFWCT